MEDWVACIKTASGETLRHSRKIQQPVKPSPVVETKIDKMLSDLVVYCQSVAFDFEGKITLCFTIAALFPV